MLITTPISHCMVNGVPYMAIADALAILRNLRLHALEEGRAGVSYESAKETEEGLIRIKDATK